MPTDRLQAPIVTGQIVNLPCVVTAVTEGPTPTITLTTVYKGLDGNTDVVGTFDAVQVTIKE